LDCRNPDIHSWTTQIGLSLKKLFEEGVVKREDLFITSKLWYAQIFSDIPVVMTAVQFEHTDAYFTFLIIHI
jgi:alcohol dehydrogenase (NADP+)